MSLLVGICGGSGSGKTTLAEMVAEHFGPRRAASLAFDNYYRDRADLSPSERAMVNYDHPDSLDIELFVAHLTALRASREVAVPIYDFTTHRRTTSVHIVDPRPVVVVEGILLLAFPEVAELLDLSVYRECPEDVRFDRRLERDVSERGRTPDSVHAQFAATVKPMHDRFVEPSMAEADLVTMSTEELEQARARVLDSVQQLVAERAVGLT